MGCFLSRLQEYFEVKPLILDRFVLSKELGIEYLTTGGTIQSTVYRDTIKKRLLRVEVTHQTEYPLRTPFYTSVYQYLNGNSLYLLVARKFMTHEEILSIVEEENV